MSGTIADSGASLPHPLLHVGRSLLADFLTTLAFAALFVATHNVALSLAASVALGLAHVAYAIYRGRTIDAMQWLTLGLVAVFGGAALATHNPVFVMVKPTLIYVAVGCVMLRRGWMTRYMTDPRAISHAADVTTRFGYAWAGLMFATGAANLALAVWASPAAWAWFVGVFPLASKIGLVGIQYAMTKSIVRRRVGAG